MSTKTRSISLVSIILVLFGGWYIYNQSQFSHTPVTLVQSGSTLVSDLANPFSSGSPSENIEEVSDKTGSILMNTGTTEDPEIVYNTTWTPRTLSGVSYQFGVGNPRETDKSVGELNELSKECRKVESTKASCGLEIITSTESVYHYMNEDGTFEEPTAKPTRMTLEIEYLVYSFLSNPILREAGVKCGEHFWRNEGIAKTIYLQDDIGFIYHENWWNPYNIDINRIITINPDTGRKELNTELIWSLYTQISTPSKLEGGNNYTNTKLTECLAANNILIPLQAHVDRHYRELIWLWGEWKVAE